MKLDEDEIKAFIEILKERPLSSMARIAAKTGILPEGIPWRKDVAEALLAANESIRPEKGISQT